jgi:hypothetical protein
MANAVRLIVGFDHMLDARGQPPCATTQAPLVFLIYQTKTASGTHRPRSRSSSTTCGGEDRIRIAHQPGITVENRQIFASTLDAAINSDGPDTPNSMIAGGRSIASGLIDSPVDVVEAALAGALSQAAAAGQWEVVARLAGELDARRRARSEAVDLQAQRAKRGLR